MVGICSSALYSTLDPLSSATGLSLGELNSGNGYMVSAQRDLFRMLLLLTSRQK